MRATTDSNVKDVDSAHPLMQAARQRAKDSLDDFLKMASHPPPGARGFVLKVALQDAGKIENIWVGALERRTRKKMFVTVSETFAGRLANTPLRLPGRKKGDRISFSRSDIRDWSYVAPDGRMVGNATACVIFALESPAAVEQAMRSFGLDCGWTKSITAASN